MQIYAFLLNPPRFSAIFFVVSLRLSLRTAFLTKNGRQMDSVEIQWRQPYVPAIPGKEERWPSGTPLPVSMAPAASSRLHREGAKRPAEGNKSLNDILSKRQGSPCENRANGRGAGTERKCANLTRPRECRMKVDSQFPRHFAVSHGTPCGRNPPPMSAPQGEWLAKGQTRFARGRTPSRAGKALRSPVFPFFLHPQGVPCGKKVSSLRKAVHFFAESNSVFTAKKQPSGRRNAPYKQFLHPRFNNPPLVCGGPSCQ